MCDTVSMGDTQALLGRIALLEAEVEHWQLLAETDDMTGVPNRRALERKTLDRDGWFVMCDLKDFKKSQDRHPEKHIYGDRIIQEFADWLDRTTREQDWVMARFGGDEFVVWCPTRVSARHIKERVRNWRSTDGAVTCRAGLGRTIAAADNAMYLRKQT